MSTSGPASRAPADVASEPATGRVIIKPRRMPGDRGPAPKLALVWATFFGAGYAPFAPGTAGTLAAIPLWWLVSQAPAAVYVVVTLLVTLTGIAAADRAGRYYGVADSGHIVIDEVAGYLVTMAFLPRTVFAAAAGFVFFRLCDVLKPWPASIFDRHPRWKNGAGVVLDDLFAGLWALLLTWAAVVAKGRLAGP